MAGSRSSSNSLPRIRLAVIFLAAACSLPLPSGAATSDNPRLHYDSATTVPLTLGTTAVWLGSEFQFKHGLAPENCHWCDRTPDGRDALNGLDASLRSKLLWDHPNTPRRMSDLLLYVGVPATTLGTLYLAGRNADRESEFGRNALMVFEALGVGMTLNQVAKFSVARQRPYIHFDPNAASRPKDADDNLSFYSGHAAVTFTMATAAGTVATLRGYRNRNWIWISGITLAATTSWFRIACDRHYFTDVAAGALFGTAVGIGLPRIMHGRAEDSDGGAASSSVPPPAFVIRLAW